MSVPPPASTFEAMDMSPRPATCGEGPEVVLARNEYLFFPFL